MTSVTQLQQWLIKGLIIPLIVLNGWFLILVFEYFKSLITIFVVAILLSFILDYPVKQLQKWNFNRPLSILIVFLFVFLLIGILGITLIPTILDESNQLIERLPSWLNSGNQQIQSLETWINQHNLSVNLSDIPLDLWRRLSSQLQQVSGQIIGSIFSAVGSIFDLVLTLVLTFYLLLHGEELWTDLFNFFPIDIVTEIRIALRETFHNYFIGQATVAATMGTAMTIAFFIVQAPFWLLFGVTIGMMALFPFGGALSIAVVSFLVALNSIWLGLKVLIIATIIDQIVENVIAPRLLGSFTGLNPVLILLFLLLGAKIAGFLGLILAVPLASFSKKLIAMIPNQSEAITNV